MIRSVLVGLTLTAAGSAFAANFTVNENQLQRLVDSAKQLDRGVERLKRDYDDNRVMPSANDRRGFRDATDELIAEVKVVQQTLRRIAQNGGGSVEPEVAKLDLAGFYLVGKVDAADQSSASKSHQEECNRVEADIKAVLGNYFDVFICGQTANVTRWPTINYFQLASNPTVSVRFPGNKRTRQLPAGDVAGSVDSDDQYAAYSSWWGACKTFLGAQKAKYGDRFLAAECGKPKNVTQWPTINYKKFLSSGVVYLFD